MIVCIVLSFVEPAWDQILMTRYVQAVTAKAQVEKDSVILEAVVRIKLRMYSKRNQDNFALLYSSLLVSDVSYPTKLDICDVLIEFDDLTRSREMVLSFVKKFKSEWVVQRSFDRPRWVLQITDVERVDKVINALEARTK